MIGTVSTINGNLLAAIVSVIGSSICASGLHAFGPAEARQIEVAISPVNGSSHELDRVRHSDIKIGAIRFDYWYRRSGFAPIFLHAEVNPRTPWFGEYESSIRCWKSTLDDQWVMDRDVQDMEKAGIDWVAGNWLGDPDCCEEIDGWVEAARVAYAMEHNRLGVMGHYYGGMLDIYSDLTAQCAAFGGHIEMIEVDELATLRNSVDDGDIEERVAEFHETFDVQSDVIKSELVRAARTSLAMDELVAQHELGSLAYYYKGTGNAANEDAISSIILANSLLTARGVPVAGEMEIKNAQAMKILDLFGVGGSFTEYYAMDYRDDVVLMGHDGPGHIAIAEGKTKIRPLEVYYGKVGRGLSVEMSIKHGPVTLLSVAPTPCGQPMLLVAHGESVPGTILEIGNTNSRYRFSIGAKNFVENWNQHGPAHHCAVGVEHVADKIDKLGRLLGIKVVQIC